MKKELENWIDKTNLKLENGIRINGAFGYLFKDAFLNIYDGYLTFGIDFKSD